MLSACDTDLLSARGEKIRKSMVQKVNANVKKGLITKHEVLLEMFSSLSSVWLKKRTSRCRTSSGSSQRKEDSLLPSGAQITVAEHVTLGCSLTTHRNTPEESNN